MEKAISITSQEATMLSEVVSSYSNSEIYTLKSAQMYCSANDKELIDVVSKRVEGIIKLKGDVNEVLAGIISKELSYKDSLLGVTKDENLMEYIHLFLHAAIAKRIGELEKQESLLLGISGTKEVYGKQNRVEMNAEFTKNFAENIQTLMKIIKLLRAETMKAFSQAEEMKAFGLTSTVTGKD